MIKGYWERGFGLISLLIFAAIVFAAANIYSYYNPEFSLSKYSPINFLRSKRDEIRVNDLKTLEKAIVDYYNDNNQMPAFDGWCGRLSSVLHPEFSLQIKPYLENQELPHDPSTGNTGTDYFYYRVDRSRYILMAVMELPAEDGGEGKYIYNFKNCHDWPGNDIYNYQIRNF
ncbi:MAG TPA: hypothetical protein VIH52_00120 [Candidatus Nanoarchaeia archaeon]|nr:hypothetical protein [uncultured archaeon]